MDSCMTRQLLDSSRFSLVMMNRDREFALKLASRFFQGVDIHLRTLKTSISSRDHEKVKDSLHGISNAAGTVGATALATMADKYYRMPDDQRLSVLTTDYSTLLACFKNTYIAISREAENYG